MRAYSMTICLQKCKISKFNSYGYFIYNVFSGTSDVVQQFTGYSFSNKRHKNETIGGPFERRLLYIGICDSVSWWLVTSLAEVASFYGNVELSMMSPNFTEGIINLISKRRGCLDVNIPMVCNFIEGIAVLWINKLDGEDRISLNVPKEFYPPNLWTH